MAHRLVDLRIPTTPRGSISPLRSRGDVARVGQWGLKADLFLPNTPVWRRSRWHALLAIEASGPARHHSNRRLPGVSGVREGLKAVP